MNALLIQTSLDDGTEVVQILAFSPSTLSLTIEAGRYIDETWTNGPDRVTVEFQREGSIWSVVSEEGLVIEELSIRRDIPVI